VNNEAQINRKQMNEHKIIEINHERNKAQAAYLSVMERAPAHEGAPFSIKRALSEICSQEARSFS
jgi:hypothetical protein